MAAVAAIFAILLAVRLPLRCLHLEPGLRFRHRHRLQLAELLLHLHCRRLAVVLSFLAVLLLVFVLGQPLPSASVLLLRLGSSIHA